MNILQCVARFLAPPTCVNCGHEGSLICRTCREQLPKPPYPSCFGCGSINLTGVSCNRCGQLISIAALTAATTYDGSVRILVTRLKFQRQREAGSVLASLLSPLLEPSNFDVVTAVPVATTRLRSRGYNQAGLIARELARSLSLPYRPLIRRVRNVRQVGRVRSVRLQQATTAFAPIHSPPGRRILLVDDVMTTGATLNACSRVLVQAHRARVWAAVVSRAEHS